MFARNTSIRFHDAGCSKAQRASEPSKSVRQTGEAGNEDKIRIRKWNIAIVIVSIFCTGEESRQNISNYYAQQNYSSLGSPM